MSAILEAVREEIAKVEHDYLETLKPLREIERLAMQLAEPADEPEEPEAPADDDDDDEPQPQAESLRRGDRALAAAKERRKHHPGAAPPADRRPPQKYSDEEVEAATVKALDAGQATPNAVMKRHLHSNADSVRRRVEELFARWEADGRIVPDAPVRGRASFKLRGEVEEPSPESEAPVSTTDDAGASAEPAHADSQVGGSDSSASDEEAKSEAEDFGLVDDETAEQVVDELEEYEQPKTNGREVIATDLQPLAEQIEQTLVEAREPLTTREVARALDLEDRAMVRRVTEKLVRMGRLQQRGYGEGGHPRYRIRPSMESQGVSVRMADRETPLEDQILVKVDEGGSMTIQGLAAAVARHPRDVAEAVQQLIGRHELKKRRAHPDAVYERPVPQAGWGRGL